jgi:A nuclease family of the HNH/ENDO VII superfamily with conserved AHH
MVYKRPDYNPQPDDGHHHGKGWNPGEPSWGEPHRPFGNENEYYAPKRSPQKPKTPAAPKSKQLNVFEANGIAFSQFDTSLYGRQFQQGSSGWREPEKQQPRYGKQLNWFAQNNFGFNNLDPALLPRRQVQYSHHQAADLLDAPLKSSDQEEPRSRRRRAPESSWPLDMDDLRRELLKRQLSVDGNTTEPKPGRRSWTEQQPRTPWDFSGLRAVSDYMDAHPEDMRKPGNSFDGLLGKTQAFKEKEAQAAAQAGIRSGFPVGGVQVAATELSPGMFESTPGQASPSMEEKPKIPDRLAQSSFSPFRHLPPDTQQQILTRQPMKNATDLEAATIQQLYHFQDAEFAHRAVESRQREAARRSAWFESIRKFGTASPNHDPGYDVGFFRSGKPSQTAEGRFVYDVTLGYQAEAYYRHLLPQAWAQWQAQKAQARQQHLKDQALKSQQQAQQQAQQKVQHQAQHQVQPRPPQSGPTPEPDLASRLSPIPFGKTGLTVPVAAQSQTAAEPIAVETPVAGFQRELVDTATQRLQANKARLNTQQKSYAHDLSPNSPRWSELRQLSQQDQHLAQKKQRLNEQAAALQEKHRPGANLAPGDTRAEFMNDMEVRDPTVRAQIDELNAQIKMIEQTRTAMKAQTPALAVIDTAKVAHAPNTQQNNQAIFKDISKGFGDINHGIDTLQAQIVQDPSKALQLDDVKAATLRKLGIDPKQKTHDPKQQAVLDYLGKEEFKDNLIKWGGLAGTGALTVGAIVGTVLAPEAALPVWMMGGATVLGAGTATYDVLQLMTIDQGAQAGQAGGQSLTSTDPETARFNLTMGYGNLALSALDVGLTAKEAVAISKLPVMRGLAGSLSAEKLTDLMRGIKAGAQGRMSEGLAAIRKLKGKILPQAEQELTQMMRDAGSGGNIAHMADGRKVERSSLFEFMTQRLEGLGERLGMNQMADWVNRKVDGLLRPFEGPQVEYVGGPQGALDHAVDPKQPMQMKGNAGGTATAKKKLKDMTPAERLADAQGKYGQIQNWDQVKSLVGQSVTQNMQLPPGYIFYEKPANFFGKRPLFILRENADDSSFVPLMIEKGKIQAGKTRLSRDLDVMKANLKGVGVTVPKDWQVNHLIPDEIAQSNPLMIEALKRDLFDVDRASNLLPMPGKTDVREANPNLIGHEGSHANYSQLVDLDLRTRFRTLQRRFGNNNIPDAEIKKAIESSENSMRRKILNRDSGIPVREDINTGTEVLSWLPLQQTDSPFSV